MVPQVEGDVKLNEPRVNSIRCPLFVTVTKNDRIYSRAMVYGKVVRGGPNELRDTGIVYYGVASPIGKIYRAYPGSPRGGNCFYGVIIP